jgi:hypothetical protein
VGGLVQVLSVSAVEQEGIESIVDTVHRFYDAARVR